MAEAKNETDTTETGFQVPAYLNVLMPVFNAVRKMLNM